MTAVVSGLPRSWHIAPSITAASLARSKSLFLVLASSITMSVWIQQSPSGCHSGSCGQSISACISGSSRAVTLSSRASSNPIDGRSAFSRSFSNSPQTRSGGEVVEWNAATEVLGFLVWRELVARSELQRAQDPQ